MSHRTLMFHEVEATAWGRFKLWVHYRWVSPVLKPMLGRESGLALWRASRRWVFGPNANNEDLIDLLQRCQDKVAARDGT